MEKRHKATEFFRISLEMPLQPKLILDTNVCGKLVTPAYRADLTDIKRRLNRNFRIVVSPQTFLELLNAIKGGDGTHFAADQDRLRLLVGTGTMGFLPFSVAFALRKVLHLESRKPEFCGPSHFRSWFRVVIHASAARIPDAQTWTPSTFHSDT
jgi:hypothetical protein